MKRVFLYIVTLSFFLGVFIASVLSLSIYLQYLFFIIGGVFIIVSFIFRGDEGVLFSKKICILGLIIVFTSVGMLRVDLNNKTDELSQYQGEKIEYRGIVSSLPDTKDTTERFIVHISKASDSIVSEDVLVISNRYPEYKYGDEIVFTGILKLPENFETYSGGPIFDYVSYLYKDGVRYIMYRPKIEKVGENMGNPIVAGLYSLKRNFSDSVERVVNEPESSLLLGLLIGDKASLGKDILDDFRRAGLSHIIVLSGYNVTIVADNLMKAFSYVSISASPFLGAISIIFFALMTGASATTVRASVMALLLILSKRVSRRYDVSRALIFAAFLMVLHNPRILLFDVSFQLSVIATIAIIYVAPIIRFRITWVTERFALRDVISTTVGTQILVLPYILHVMGTLSLVSIVSNILVLPVVPLAMFSGFVTGIVGFISPLLSVPLAWISDIVLGYIIEVTHLSASLPFASLNLSLPLSATVMMYLLFIVFLFRFYKKRPVDTTGRHLISLW